MSPNAKGRGLHVEAESLRELKPAAAAQLDTTSEHIHHSSIFCHALSQLNLHTAASVSLTNFTLM